MTLIVAFRRLHQERRELSDYEVNVSITTSPTTVEHIAQTQQLIGHRRADD